MLNNIFSKPIFVATDRYSHDTTHLGQRKHALSIWNNKGTDLLYPRGILFLSFLSQGVCVNFFFLRIFLMNYLT